MASSNFDFPGEVSRFPKDTQDIVRTAHALGWTLRWSGSERHVLQITSPIETSKSILIPSTNLNANRARSTVQQIARYSDPDRVKDYVESKTTVKAPAVRLGLGLPAREETPTPKQRAAEAGNTTYDTALAAAMAEAESKATEMTSRVRDKDPDDGPVPDRTVVTEKPWLVRRGGDADSGKGRVYESPAVIERVWSDGFIDYRCRYCEWSHENPRSVSSHRSQSHREAQHEAAQAKQKILRVTNYEETGIVRPRSAIRRLRSDLLRALDHIEGWRDMDPSALAEAVAEQVYAERPDRPAPEPLTAEQIVERIGLLLDDGRLADMHQSVERMAAELAEATERAERAEADAERLHEERKVLRDLLSESEASS